MKRYRLEVNEHQLWLISQCVEDCHRFMSGDMELLNCTSRLKTYHELKEKLDELQPLVTPDLSSGARHKWNGKSCKNEQQRKFIAESYYLYREIAHRLMQDKNKEYQICSHVLLDPTLRCSESGEPIKVELIKDKDMTTIKFRGKDRITKEWHYGNIIEVDDMPAIVNTSMMYKDASSLGISDDKWNWILGDTIGQCIGVRDMNGNEIYEGDILQDKGLNKGVVICNIDGFFVDFEGAELQPFSTGLNDVCSIVGNIHDNIDLVKGVQNADKTRK